MMKKFQKRLLLCLLVVLICTALILNFLYFFVPYKKHLASNRNAVASDVFLPKPDFVLYIGTDGKDRLLTDAEVTQIYEEFQVLMNRVKKFNIKQHKCDGEVKINSEKIIRTANVPKLEFRYEQRQRYMGSSPASAGKGYEDALTYDAMMLLIHNGYIELIPYKGIGYVRNSSEHARMDFYANYYEFKNVLGAL